MNLVYRMSASIGKKTKLTSVYGICLEYFCHFYVMDKYFILISLVVLDLCSGPSSKCKNEQRAKNIVWTVRLFHAKRKAVLNLFVKNQCFISGNCIYVQYEHILKMSSRIKQVRKHKIKTRKKTQNNSKQQSN